MNEQPVVPVCYRHPDRETRLGCSSCGRPVCVDCVQRASVGQLCRECVAERGGQRVINRQDLARARTARPPVTTGILVVCVAIFALGALSPDVRTWFLQYGAQINPYVAEGEWYRLGTAAFLHADLMHILFNMWALYVFGPQLEREVGSPAFAALYIGSALAGGAAFYLLSPGGLAVGASGAIFGLFGAWVAAAYRSRHTAWGQSGLRQLLTLLAINLALPLFIEGIAWEAHVGGLLAGVLVMTLWGVPAFRSIVRRTLIGLVVALVSLVLVIV